MENVETEKTTEIISITHPLKNRPRNYSHLKRNPELFDEVEVNNVTYKIPARMGSNYWAILRVMYININKPVYFQDLIQQVEAEMTDYDEDNKDLFLSKSEIAVWDRSQQKAVIKKANSWQNRIINNAKTMTRYKDYGKRLYEKGHIMRLKYDNNSKPYFILYDNLDCLKGK